MSGITDTYSVTIGETGGGTEGGIGILSESEIFSTGSIRAWSGEVCCRGMKEVRLRAFCFPLSFSFFCCLH